MGRILIGMGIGIALGYALGQRHEQAGAVVLEIVDRCFDTAERLVNPAA